MSSMLLQLSLCVVTMATMASSANVLLDYNLCLRIEQMLNTLRLSNAQLLRDVAQIMNELEDVKDQIGLSDTEGECLADRTATQYDRLLASSCRPSVRLSVCL